MQVDDFSGIDFLDLQQAQGWQAQAQLIHRWAEKIPTKPEIRSEAWRVRGCESAAWLAFQPLQPSGFRWAWDSESRIIRGLGAGVLAHFELNQQSDLSALNWSDLLTQTGLTRYLSPSRNNGLRALIDRVYASLNMDYRWG